MKKFAYISLSLLTLSVVGCNIEVNEGYSDDWLEEGTLSERADAACQSYCLRLIECGVVSDGAFQACTDLCVDRYKQDEETVSEGCECVSASSCDDDEISECPGDPIPGVWTDDDALDTGDGDGDGDGDTSAEGDGDGDGDGGTTGGGAPNETPDGTSCTINHECAIGEDCVDHQCLPRCAASCQCADGQACEDGYCRTPQEPVAECEDTCDCTAGDECVSGICM